MRLNRRRWPEERVGLVKHHLDVLWHGYFRPEHLQQYPDLHEILEGDRRPG